MADDNWLDVAASARLAGKSERQIRRWCEAGKLAHRMEKGAYLIEPVSLERLIAETSKETAEDRNVVSDDSDGSESESPSPSAPEPDSRLGADIRPSPQKAYQTSDTGDKDITPADISAMSEKLRTSEDAEDIEEKELQQAVAEVKDVLKERLDTEKRCIAQVENVLTHLDRKYQAERERNRKAQESLKSLLAELQVPLAERKPSLWRRLFDRR